MAFISAVLVSLTQPSTPVPTLAITSKFAPPPPVLDGTCFPGRPPRHLPNMFSISAVHRPPLRAVWSGERLAPGIRIRFQQKMLTQEGWLTFLPLLSCARTPFAPLPGQVLRKIILSSGNSSSRSPDIPFCGPCLSALLSVSDLGPQLLVLYLPRIRLDIVGLAIGRPYAQTELPRPGLSDASLNH